MTYITTQHTYSRMLRLKLKVEQEAFFDVAGLSDQQLDQLAPEFATKVAELVRANWRRLVAIEYVDLARPAVEKTGT